MFPTYRETFGDSNFQKKKYLVRKNFLLKLFVGYLSAQVGKLSSQDDRADAELRQLLGNDSADNETSLTGSLPWRRLRKDNLGNTFNLLYGLKIFLKVPFPSSRERYAKGGFYPAVIGGICVFLDWSKVYFELSVV